MLKDLNYVIFDFETTWLDLKKDEPIQIGLIQFDKDFNIKNTFSSYIKPKKNISELKDIVSFITWLSLSDLQEAPYMEDVLEKLKTFFDENTVIIWHNIEFDYNMLKKFWKDLKVLDKVDTFIVSKLIIHNFPSYSLEVLFEYIKEEKNIDLSVLGKAHDALVDCWMNFYLFKYSIKYLQELFDTYPVISDFIKRSNSFWNTILQLSTFKTKNIDYFFPSFKKQIPSSKKLLVQTKWIFDSLKQIDDLNLSSVDLNALVNEIVAKNDKFVIAVSNKWKLKILESLFDKIWIEDVWYLSGDRVFDTEKIKKFLSKSNFDDFEINFIIKYFSLIKQGFSYFEITDWYEAKILNYISEKKQIKRNKIILTTHTWLFQNILLWYKFEDYNLLFLDKEWWYVNLSKVVNRPYDLYYFLNKLENILYFLKFEADNEIVIQFEKFVNAFLIFIGVFYIELTDKFRWKNVSKIEIWPILSDIDFWKTRKIYENLKSYLSEIIKYLQKFSDILEELNNIFLNLDNILKQVVKVEKKMIWEKFYFVFYTENVVINWSFFVDLLKWKFKNIWFWSLEKVPIGKFSKKLDFDYIKNNKKSVFILSTKRSSSKQLFEKIIKDKKLIDDYIILVENLTWSRGKNLFLAKKYDKKIVIGGNEFYFMLIWQDIKFDDIIIYDISWPMEGVILKEISWWKVNDL